MKLGRFEIHVVSDGTFWLDAGTMFGIVPKVLWEQLVDVDERNRAEFALNALLVRTPDVCALIDVGLGRHYDAKTQDIFGIGPGEGLLSSLAQCGVTPEDVGLVVPTHLHLDHAGWCTRPSGDGAVRPTFPQARYVVQADELDDALHPCELTRGSYVPDHFCPLAEAGLLETVHGDAEVVTGIRVVRTGGHTLGHQAVVIESDGERCVFVGDVAPTAMHMRPTYGMAYDSFPLEVVAKKRQLLAMAEAQGALVAFPHDMRTPLARVRRNASGQFIAEAV